MRRLLLVMAVFLAACEEPETLITSVWDSLPGALGPYFTDTQFRLSITADRELGDTAWTVEFSDPSLFEVRSHEQHADSISLRLRTLKPGKTALKLRSPSGSYAALKDTGGDLELEVLDAVERIELHPIGALRVDPNGGPGDLPSLRVISGAGDAEAFFVIRYFQGEREVFGTPPVEILSPRGQVRLLRPGSPNVDVMAVGNNGSGNVVSVRLGSTVRTVRVQPVLASEIASTRILTPPDAALKEGETAYAWLAAVDRTGKEVYGASGSWTGGDGAGLGIGEGVSFVSRKGKALPVSVLFNSELHAQTTLEGDTLQLVSFSGCNAGGPGALALAVLAFLFIPRRRPTRLTSTLIAGMALVGCGNPGIIVVYAESGDHKITVGVSDDVRGGPAVRAAPGAFSAGLHGPYAVGSKFSVIFTNAGEDLSSAAFSISATEPSVLELGTCTASTCEATAGAEGSSALGINHATGPVARAPFKVLAPDRLEVHPLGEWLTDPSSSTAVSEAHVLETATTARFVVRSFAGDALLSGHGAVELISNTSGFEAALIASTSFGRQDVLELRASGVSSGGVITLASGSAQVALTIVASSVVPTSANSELVLSPEAAQVDGHTIAAWVRITGPSGDVVHGSQVRWGEAGSAQFADEAVVLLGGGETPGTVHATLRAGTPESFTLTAPVKGTDPAPAFLQ